jgi:hypothetical protein
MSRMRPFSARSLSLVLGIALSALTAVGCQGRGSVSGKVTHKNKPVVFGTVLIQGKDGLRQGNIAPDGSFTVRDVAAGDIRVAVNSPNPKSIQLYPNKNPNNKQEPYPDVPGWFAIPKQYESVESSGLTYKIRGGSNTIDIDLK